jgi:uncharacterized protein (DUF885 family)
VTTDAAEAATGLADRFWERLLELEPLTGTYVGDERFDDRLPDPSEEGLEERRSFFEGALGELSTIDRASLDTDLRTTLDVLETGSLRALSDIEYRIDRLQAVTHLFGPGNLLATLASVQQADTPERAERYAGRLRAIPAWLDATGAVAMDGGREGMASPRLVVDRSIAQVERLVAMAPEDSPGMAPVEHGPDGAGERVAGVLRDDVWPAYERYLEMLRAYRSSFATETIGLSFLPDGEAAYAAQLEGFTTLPLTAKDVHETGLAELERIQLERQEIAERLGHPDVHAALAEYEASGRNRASTREEMLRLVEQQVERSWEAAPRFFGRLPRANCTVKAVEEFREDDMPGAFYNPPSADGSRRGTYYVNTGQVGERPLHQTATTSFHEANPGHHFQISIEMEFADRLPLRRFGGFLVGDAMVEGWGLYSERLADEMGLFLDDYERLGMLEAQGFRAGRLIVDTGIHTLGWDRERAVRQVMETGSARADSEIEVDRYISWPGQACAYMIGRMEIDRWRAELADRNGDAFSLQGFHDRLLALGSLGLSTLARELGVSDR